MSEDALNTLIIHASMIQTYHFPVHLQRQWCRFHFRRRMTPDLEQGNSVSIGTWGPLRLDKQTGGGTYWRWNQLVAGDR